MKNVNYPEEIHAWRSLAKDLAESGSAILSEVRAGRTPCPLVLSLFLEACTTYDRMAEAEGRESRVEGQVAMPPDIIANCIKQSLPPLSLHHFSEVSGISLTTMWRYRLKGMIRTCVIAGRHYLTAAEVAEFNTRLAAGEFAGNGPRTPSRRKIAESEVAA
jgi:hypothetical protein